MHLSTIIIGDEVKSRPRFTNCQTFNIRLPDIKCLFNSPEVLGLYRKRERARRMHEHGVLARFRYNDLKEAARDCDGRGHYANSMVGRSGVELCRGCAAERDT